MFLCIEHMLLYTIDIDLLFVCFSKISWIVCLTPLLIQIMPVGICCHLGENNMATYIFYTIRVQFVHSVTISFVKME